ncbi:STAS domain-containing protein [Aquibium sp. ELW1220]|uniref:STAS domain-containing protein n=1 Tax=Aquibium sp. ELW1220 TaxID=2976766 RepID=UPI0025B210FF|nr:STAS domain-containing protein [Aquibium sp. ELW1220]MDN2584354.1 STAS domain-containing protein [Aquibium sp. ELW1220]
MAPIEIELEAWELRANRQGFNVLNRLSASLADCGAAQIEINCKRVSWLDSHLCSALATICGPARARGCRVAFSNLQPNVRLVLSKIGLLSNKAVDLHRTTIPLTAFKLHDEVEFAKYSRRHLARPEMPKMTDGLRNKVFEGIDELFANSSLHSHSPFKVIASGQFYPQKRRLALAISDGGIGIGGSLAAAGQHFRTDALAIDYAMQPDTTSRRGYIPGGLGLNVLRQFIGGNGGKLTVVSGRGFWQQDADRVVKSELHEKFPGTAVIVEINTGDRRSYRMQSSPSPNDVW